MGVDVALRPAPAVAAEQGMGHPAQKTRGAPARETAGDRLFIAGEQGEQGDQIVGIDRAVHIGLGKADRAALQAAADHRPVGEAQHRMFARRGAPGGDLVPVGQDDRQLAHGPAPQDAAEEARQIQTGKAGRACETASRGQAVRAHRVVSSIGGAGRR
jgi:hypothetical protein